MIEKRRLQPTVSWELVAWHEDNMDAANGILAFDHMVAGLTYSPPTVLGAATAPWS